MAGALKSFIKDLKNKDWLSPKIETHFSKVGTSYESWTDVNPYIHPSSSASRCSRFIQLGFLGHRMARTMPTRRLDNGIDTHTRWNRYFQDMGLLYAANFKRKYTDCEFYIGGKHYEHINWSGECDVILDNPKTKAMHIGEIKSMAAARWDRVPAQTSDYFQMANQISKIERRYVVQLAQYQTIFSQVEMLPLSKDCFFLFENTDTQEIKIRWLTFTDEYKQASLDIAVEALYNTLQGTLISPPFDFESNTCISCGRRTTCMNIEYGEAKETNIIQEKLKNGTKGN